MTIMGNDELTLTSERMGDTASAADAKEGEKPSKEEKANNTDEKESHYDGNKNDEDCDTKMKEVEETEEEKKKKEEPIENYANWPLCNVKQPHDNDVKYGRGGGTNHHKGNKLYRKMVENRKVEYLNCKKLDKPRIALEIIRLWRAQTPPGRFLKRDGKTGLWNDVGDKKAREKTSQALREDAPLIRKQQEGENSQNDGDEKTNDGNEEDTQKETPQTTPFVEETKESDEVKNAVLASMGGPPHGPDYYGRVSSDNSLSFNPLIGATTARPADKSAFESSIYYGPGYFGEVLSTLLQEDPITWLGGETKRMWSGDHAPTGETRQPWPRDYTDRLTPVHSVDISLSGYWDFFSMAKPTMVKRDTSHQNETVETKPSVKRSALNRDNSLASNQLKEKYMPELCKTRFDTDQEMRMLSDSLEQSTIDSAIKYKEKPIMTPLNDEKRVSTFDEIVRDLKFNPVSRMIGERISTMDALALNFDDDPFISQQFLQRESSRDRRISSQ